MSWRQGWLRCRRTPAPGVSASVDRHLDCYGLILGGRRCVIIFGPLLIPVAGQIGINELHFGVVLVIAMGIGLFAPPLGLGLYGACLIGGVPIETTVLADTWAILARCYLCLLVIGVRPGSDALASASAGLPVGARARPLRLEMPEHAWRTSTALHNRVAGLVRLDRAPSLDMVHLARRSSPTVASRAQPTARLSRPSSIETI